MSRVLVIGLDGATLDLIGPWVQAGKLPNIARLMHSGRYAPLRSVYPVISSAAWTSFMTGMNPGKHGIYDFVRRDPSSYRLRVVTNQQRTGESLWKILSRNGKSVAVINVPMTYPPEEVNGIIVTGLGTPNHKAFTYPPEWSDELLSNGYIVNKSVAYHPGNEDVFLRETYQINEQITQLALKQMQTRPWDLFMIVYRDTDELEHFFWKHMDPTHPCHDPALSPTYKNAILEYHQVVDRCIGRLIDQAGEDATIIIMSDHGHGPLYQDVLLNEWLKQAGFLVTREAGQAQSKKLLSRLGITRNNISRILRGAGLGKLETWIKETLKDRIEILPVSQKPEFPDAVDWSRTKAYSFGYTGQIYINLEGREPQGIVKPGAEYERVLDEITAALTGLVDPADHLPVVDQVFRSKEIFSGPKTVYAPDLMIVMRNFSYTTRKGFEFGNEANQIFTKPANYESGSHRMDGLLILAGEGSGGVVRGMEKPCIIDLAPTILHLLGCPVPTDMDGKVLKDWITSSRPIAYSAHAEIEPTVADDLSDEDEQDMIERLKGLGYLE